MYQKIQICKKQKFSKTDTALKTGIDRKTVKKYWDMTEEEYLSYKAKLEDKVKVFDNYREGILNLLNVNKDIKNHKVYSSSIYDVLEEMHGTLPGSERTLRNYISYLKQSDDYNFSTGVRFYTAVDELPFGKQLQLDFGETKISSGEKVYIFATVLSASRFKYVSIQKRPFKTVDVIKHILDCFDCIGGIPDEIVIDQDKVMIVDENKGDFVLTKAFSDFKKEQGFKLFVCRKADPESKGKVENLVKYVKTSFFSAREFKSFNDIPVRLESWLDRRANGKISQANGCIPNDLILLEREKLNPLKLSIYRTERIVDRQPRKVTDKCLISVDSCFYSVPKKYMKKQVWIYKTESKLYIYNSITGDLIACHDVSLIPGKQVIDRKHIRSLKDKPIVLAEQLKEKIDSDLWKKFVDKQYSRFIRYFRDQQPAMLEFVESKPELDILEDAIQQCFELERYSAANLKESYKYYEGLKEDVLPNIIPKLLKNVKNEPSPKIQKRNLSYYSSLISIIGGIL